MNTITTRIVIKKDFLYSRREQTGLFDKHNHFEKPLWCDINIAWGNAPRNPNSDHLLAMRKQ
jgi:hypothetical protein